MSEGEMVQRLFAVVLVAALAIKAQATTANFDGLTAGTEYAAGSLFSSGGLDFDVLFGLDPLKVTAVGSAPHNPYFAGNYLNLTSSDLLNANLPTGASQIQFDFYESSPAVAFVVNGSWFDYSQLPETINGVSVTKVLPANGWGAIIATGGINSFVVDGTDFLIDNLSATLSAGLPGDYNKNQIVDAADYVLWRKILNTPSGYNSWRSNFGIAGMGVGSGMRVAAFAVPEPFALALVLLALPWFVVITRGRRSAHHEYAGTHIFVCRRSNDS
jgi:hypothetical protein